ncbi:MAG: pyridoxamine 5'-phosphate oxidase family protein, partial [Acidocella sp.]|nr:pyridoxamine 5'-phosphate oxidase family protein [Acidocella sp.]
GTLATLHKGEPHASLVTPAVSADGLPILLLSGLAAHTRHLHADPACALLVTGTPADENPQTTPRLSLTGTAREVPADGVRAHYLATHPYAARYVDFTDFSFWKILIISAQYIGGFASASQLNVAALQHEISERARSAYG